MTNKIVFPILNTKVSLFKGLPALYLSPATSIGVVSSDDYYLIKNSNLIEYSDLVSTKTKCIQVKNVSQDDFEKHLKIEASIISFALNCFRDSAPIILLFALQVVTKNKSTVNKCYNLPSVAEAHLLRNKPFKFHKKVEPKTVIIWYGLISEVLKRYPAVTLTLDRFNGSLLRSQGIDKIVDITISLESLIRGTAELRHRFSLFNAWVAEKNVNKREEVCDILRMLYDARSSIVHGDSDYIKKTNEILENWDQIVNIAQNAIVYYLLYISQHNVESWYEHQEKLALGIEQRII